jgi:hypothetical protein
MKNPSDGRPSPPDPLSLTPPKAFGAGRGGASRPAGRLAEGPSDGSFKARFFSGLIRATDNPMKTRSLFAILLLAALVGCGRKPQVIAADLPVAAPAMDCRFTEITAQAGIKFTHVNGAFGAKLLPETMGSGAAFIDYDGDGYPDLFFVNSRDWTDEEVRAFTAGSGKKYASLIPANRPRRRATCALYHNNGNGAFTDVTMQAGLDIPMYGMGAAVGDYDNDGRPDLYVTALGRDYLFHNEGNGRFKEVAAEAGVKDGGWSTSAAWVDYDRDGKLDLFVCHYVDWTPATDIYCTLDGRSKSYCTPQDYTGQTCRLYHNEGHGRFQDVSAKAGILRQNGRKCQGKSLGVAVCDINNDGWPDIVVANDTEPNYLFQNNRDGTFAEVGQDAGIAVSESGQARAAMGVDAADLDHSGRMSLLFGNFSNQMLGLYQNHGGCLFIDIAPRSEVGQASLQFLAFGTLFVDVDNDGWPDIFAANGHVETDINRVQRDVTYAERPLLFRNEGRGQFKEIGLTSGEALKKPAVGRGAACADIDLDGAADIVMTVNGGAPILFHNDTGRRNNSLRVVLEGTKSNRSAIGAVVECKMGAETSRCMVRSGSSYCSACELPVTLGLGKAAKADAITIHWPSDKVTELKDVPANQIITVNEDRGIVKQQPFPHR